MPGSIVLLSNIVESLVNALAIIRHGLEAFIFPARDFLGCGVFIGFLNTRWRFPDEDVSQGSELLRFELVPSLITAAALGATSSGVAATAHRDVGALASETGALLSDAAARKTPHVTNVGRPSRPNETSAHWIGVAGKMTQEAPQAARICDLSVFVGPLEAYHRLLPNVLESTLLQSGTSFAVCPGRCDSDSAKARSRRVGCKYPDNPRGKCSCCGSLGDRGNSPALGRGDIRRNQRSTATCGIHVVPWPECTGRGHSEMARPIRARTACGGAEC